MMLRGGRAVRRHSEIHRYRRQVVFLRCGNGHEWLGDNDSVTAAMIFFLY